MINSIKKIVLISTFLLVSKIQYAQSGFDKQYFEGYQATNVVYMEEKDHQIYALMNCFLNKWGFAWMTLDTLGNVLSIKEYFDDEYSITVFDVIKMSNDNYLIGTFAHSSFRILYEMDKQGIIANRKVFTLPNPRKLLSHNNSIFLATSDQNNFFIQNFDLQLDLQWELVIPKEYELDPYEHRFSHFNLNHNGELVLHTYSNLAYRIPPITDRFNFRFIHRISQDGKLVGKRKVSDPTSLAYYAINLMENGNYLGIRPPVNTTSPYYPIPIFTFNSQLNRLKNYDISIHASTDKTRNGNLIPYLTHNIQNGESALHLNLNDNHTFVLMKLDADMNKKWEVVDSMLYHPNSTLIRGGPYLSNSGNIYKYGFFELGHENPILEANLYGYIRKYDKNGCLDPNCQNVISSVHESISVEEDELNNVIHVFPNPSNGNKINVQVHFPEKFKGTLRLINTNGHLLEEKIMTQNPLYVFDTHNLPNGIYYIQLVDSSGPMNNFITKKIIILNEN